MSFSCLPLTSLAPFQARRLARPSFLWKSQSFGTGADLAEHTYCVPLPGEDISAYLPDEKAYDADRYGGWGITSNGGSARCGTRHGIQIKGIGRTPLAGSDAAHWHSYGGATLIEAVREAIWGEICHAALPFGAYRVQAIVATGTDVPVRYPKPGGPEQTPRAIILREPALRPAHFMRAVYFSRSDQAANGLPDDFARTQNALNRLSMALEQIYEFDKSIGAQHLGLKHGLGRMLWRLAHQAASAFAKRIMHGAFSPSNLGLDGRWLDFGVTSSLSDYGRIILARRLPDFWRQNTQIENMIHELTFYINKFLALPPEHAIDSNALIRGFNDEFKRRRGIEFLKIAGLTEDIIATCEPALQVQFVEAVLAVIRSGNTEPFKLKHPCPRYVPRMPEKMGTFSLNDVMLTINLSKAPADAEESLRAILPDMALRTRIVSSYYSIIEHSIAAVPPERRASFLFYMRLNSIRLNTRTQELYSTDLDPKIEELVCQRGDLSSFIDGIVDRMQPLLVDASDGRLKVRTDEGKTLYVDIDEGVKINGTSVKLQQIRKLSLGFISQSSLGRLIDLCETAF